MKIITITLNPAFDLHYGIPDFKAGGENYVETATVSAGGKSVNISRALHANGVENTACIVMGKENADAFLAKLREEGIDDLSFMAEGRIRENITVHDRAGEETRISFDNFSLCEDALEKIYLSLSKKVEKDTVLAISGRLPRGICLEKAVAFCQRLKRLTPYLIVDSNSFSASDLKAIGPWLIKPNEGELRAMTGANTKTEEEIIKAATSLCQAGIAQVLVTLGSRGAVYVGTPGSNSQRVCAVITQPKQTPVSTVGAGDSTIAGFIKGWAMGQPIEQCLKTAIAFGAASCLREGTAPPLPCDVERIRKDVSVMLKV